MATMEERVSRLEGITEQIDHRLGSLDAEIRDLRAEMRSNFRWLMGAILGMWVTMVAVVLGALIAR